MSIMMTTNTCIVRGVGYRASVSENDALAAVATGYVLYMLARGGK